MKYLLSKLPAMTLPNRGFRLQLELGLDVAQFWLTPGSQAKGKRVGGTSVGGRWFRGCRRAGRSSKPRCDVIIGIVVIL